MIYRKGQSNDSRNSIVLSSRLNSGTEAAVLTETGKQFHALGAATGEERTPRDDRRVGHAIVPYSYHLLLQNMLQKL